MSDLDLLTKPERTYASLFANSAAGLDWIARNVARPACRSMAMIDARFVGEFRRRMEGDGLTVDMWEACDE
jgi:hypothetical protein